MISYISVIQTKSVSVIVFEIIAIKALFDLSRSKVKSLKTCMVSLKPWYKHSCIKWRWFIHQKAKIEILTFQGHSRSRSRSSQNWFIDFCMYAWLPYQYLQQFARYSHLKILQTRVWPFMVIQGQILLHQMKAHTWFPIPLQFKPSPYLLPYSSYLTK